MMNARRIGRLGMLAVGLGIGAAVAATPGIAWADSPAPDPVSWLAGLDPGDLSAAATPAASSLDLEISVDGYTLLDLGTGATATSGTGDIAIAFGNGSTATAEGGFGDYALATTGATAVAGDTADGATGNNFDLASASGGGTQAYAGENGSFDVASAAGQGADSNAGESNDPSDPSNFDLASSWGHFTEADAGGIGYENGGSGDAAFVLDPFGTAGSYATAGSDFTDPGSFDLAGGFGDGVNAVATGANWLTDLMSAL
jgi:hypothetical protein